ncbi:MAG: helix-turn-helix domain-containing protein [Micromonosporaceae bacterium]|nr:helix-turn-helix domain-containing protein [Micromonosporaceae bacterium]
MAGGRHAPNRQLAWARLQRGWSYEELATRIRTEMRNAGDVDTGLTANTVRRWETGERSPDPRYRKHLVTVFGMSASDLGLLLPEELALRPVADVASEVRRLLSMMAEEARANGLDRATFLRSLLGAGALPLVAGLLGPDPEPVRRLAAAADDHVTDAGAVDAYSRIVAGQRALYWTSPASELFEAVYANAQLGLRLLRGAAKEQVRSPLADAFAECAMLAGRIAFFDLREPAVAQRCYDAALTATREAGDHALAAGVLGHMAFIPGFAKDTTQALELVDSAHQHCWYGVSPLIRSWLHCVASEAIGHSNEPKSYEHRVGLAEESLADGSEPTPEWFDFYDASRLSGFAGYCALAADDRATATTRLQAALDQLSPNAGKQRAVLLADLATAQVEDTERATALLHEALDAIEHDWYAIGHERVGEVGNRLPDGALKTEVCDRHRALSPVAW